MKMPIVYRFTLWTILPLLCCPPLCAVERSERHGVTDRLARAVLDDKQLLMLFPLTRNLLLTVLLLALAAARNLELQMPSDGAQGREA
jgi:hypothetical protein